MLNPTTTFKRNKPMKSMMGSKRNTRRKSMISSAITVTEKKKNMNQNELYRNYIDDGDNNNNNYNVHENLSTTKSVEALRLKNRQLRKSVYNMLKNNTTSTGNNTNT